MELCTCGFLRRVLKNCFSNSVLAVKTRWQATFEVFIGVRDDKTTAELKLFGDNLQMLEQNFPSLYTILEKGQALQFNYLFEKGAFILHPDNTFSVDFAKVEAEVENLNREILTIQAKGDKNASKALLDKY